jgi:cysteinyl-tRNA synthetase
VLESSPGQWLERRRDRLVERRGLDRARVELLLAQRADARRSKDFARSDAIRGALLDLGVEVQDGPDGTRWKVKA